VVTFDNKDDPAFQQMLASITRMRCPNRQLCRTRLSRTCRSSISQEESGRRRAR
jgi:hypothetical protein